MKQQHRPYDNDHQLLQEFDDEVQELRQLKRVRRLLQDIKLTRAYEEYSEEFDREEARLAAQGAPNQCPYPFSR